MSKTLLAHDLLVYLTPAPRNRVGVEGLLLDGLMCLPCSSLQTLIPDLFLVFVEWLNSSGCSSVLAVLVTYSVKLLSMNS
jgi:hypothetical protein